MRATIVVEDRYVRAPDGTVWSAEAPNYELWQRRYLSIFEGITVVARTIAASDPDPSLQRADGPSVTFVDPPYYLGPWQWLRQLRRLRRLGSSLLDPSAAWIFRVPSPLLTTLSSGEDLERRPYLALVVGDPSQLFSWSSMGSPLASAAGVWLTAAQRRQCACASCAAYVTGSYLQERFPSAGRMIALHDIDLAIDSFADPALVRARSERADPIEHPPSLITVSTLDQRHKGVDVLLHAMAGLRDRGHAFELEIVGEGRLRHSLGRLTRELGLEERVSFRGRVRRGPALWGILDEADLFILPSRSEGSPRALIEAMARGLPAIGTAVGGVPELLSKRDLLPPDQPQKLAAAIEAMLADRHRMTDAALRNRAKAEEFSRERLEPRWRDVLTDLASMTREWLER